MQVFGMWTHEGKEVKRGKRPDLILFAGDFY
jgi:hypothetical protein